MKRELTPSEDQFDLKALDLGVRMNEIRHIEASQPLAAEVNGHIYLFQDGRGPVVCTRNQFEKIAKQLGIT